MNKPHFLLRESRQLGLWGMGAPDGKFIPGEKRALCSGLWGGFQGTGLGEAHGSPAFLPGAGAVAAGGRAWLLSAPTGMQTFQTRCSTSVRAAPSRPMSRTLGPGS